jgi:hypothetical protein
MDGQEYSHLIDVYSAERFAVTARLFAAWQSKQAAF